MNIHVQLIINYLSTIVLFMLGLPPTKIVIYKFISSAVLIIQVFMLRKWRLETNVRYLIDQMFRKCITKVWWKSSVRDLDQIKNISRTWSKIFSLLEVCKVVIAYLIYFGKLEKLWKFDFPHASVHLSFQTQNKHCPPETPPSLTGK